FNLRLDRTLEGGFLMTQSNRAARRPSRRVRCLLTAAMALIFGAGGTVLAQAGGGAPGDKDRTSGRDAAERSEDAQRLQGAKKAGGRQPVSRFVAGVRVSVDPATGKLRQPTPEEARQLAAGPEEMLSQSPEGRLVVHHPD